jgi:aspartate kinase
MEKIKAGGIIQNIKLAKIDLKSVPNRPGIASAVLNALGEKFINVEFIVQAIELNTRANMAICVNMADLEATLSAIEGAKSNIQAEEVACHPNVVIVSIFGPHFRENPGIAGRAFSALAAAGINILAISTSISTISCVIEDDCLNTAVDGLRAAFDIPSNAVFTASRGVSLRLQSTK